MVRRESFVVSAPSLSQEIPVAPSKMHTDEKYLKVHCKGNKSKKSQAINPFEGNVFWGERL